jgi:hypothetical protein
MFWLRRIDVHVHIGVLFSFMIAFSFNVRILATADLVLAWSTALDVRDIIARHVSLHTLPTRGAPSIAFQLACWREGRRVSLGIHCKEKDESLHRQKLHATGIFLPRILEAPLLADDSARSRPLIMCMSRS